MLEQLAVQVAKIIRDVEARRVLVVRWQQHAEIVVAHIGRKVIAGNALDARTGVLIDDGGLQYLDQRKGIVRRALTDVHFDRDDVQLQRITVALGVIPMRQIVEAVVDHR